MEPEPKSVTLRVLVAGAAILAVALVAQLVLPGPDPEPPADSARPTSSRSVPPAAAGTPETAVACIEHPPIPNPAAPAYQGRGPHPIIPGSSRGPLGGGLHVLEIGDGYLPRGWLPPNRTEFTSHWWTSSMAALIMCPTAVRRTGTKPVGTCEWIRFPPTKVYPATWTFAVHEIRTGRLVATFSLPSDSSRGRTCPGSMPAPPHDSAQPPDSEALKAVVGPLVMRHVP